MTESDNAAIVPSELTAVAKYNPHVFYDKDEFNQLVRVSTAFSKTAVIPEIYRGKPEDCMVAVDLANRMALSPLMVMQNLYIVKGKPVWSGQAVMSLIKSSGDFRSVHPQYTGKANEDSWGCRVVATRISDGETVKGPEVTIAMAKAEEWYSKKDKYGNETSKWQTMPELMLAYRAAAFFGRVYCPERLMGIYAEGEPEDIVIEREEVPDIL